MGCTREEKDGDMRVRLAHDGKIDVVGGVRGGCEAIGLPIGRRDVLHLHTERFVAQNRKFVIGSKAYCGNGIRRFVPNCEG